MAKIHLAELDDRGNVLGVLTSTRKAADEALADDTRQLVEWDEHVAAERAYTRRWDGKRFVDAEQAHVARIEKDRDAAERDRKRFLAEQKASQE